MRTCPKCGRSFRNCNQSHSCGKAPQTIEEYILGQPEEVQPILRQLPETGGTHVAVPRNSITGNPACIVRRGKSSALRKQVRRTRGRFPMQKLLSWFVAGLFTWDLLYFVHIGISQQTNKLKFN